MATTAPLDRDAETARPASLPSDDANEKSGVAINTLTADQSDDEDTRKNQVPWTWKFASIALVTTIGFGSQWSSGISGAMKSTIKKELGISNTQFSLLEASEDFMVTALMLLSGIVTDRIGAMLYGNFIYSAGSILVAAAAQTRSYKFMVAGRVVRALGDIATQVAQYKVFSSWFAPSNGFASTLGFELGIGKIGEFAGKFSANIIAKRTGNFAWVFWVAVFMNLFTNVVTVFFYWFTKVAHKKFQGVRDPATGEQLTEKSKKFQLRKVLELPWSFWAVMAFSLFETSTAMCSCRMPQSWLSSDSAPAPITAGWYSATLQYAGFFVVPLLGVFLDVFGQRISILAFCGVGMFTSMLLVCFANNTTGTAASFGVFAFAYCFGPVTIIDSTRTAVWDSSVFGSAYSLKITMNNAMNIIVRIVTGAIQDADYNSYDKVTIVYAILAGISVVVSIGLFLLALKFTDLGHLQWSRKVRIARGEILNEQKRKFHEEDGHKNRVISMACFVALIALILGSWCGYFWGVATGNND
ncbi:Major facilitator superfamily domain-containing protein 1 [Colletotrichum sp. SAR11_59]|nr:Major facilitator superfamily domain-containing protein 1 [Colletotrichum sp. SAR11_59]